MRHGSGHGYATWHSFEKRARRHADCLQKWTAASCKTAFCILIDTSTPVLVEIPSNRPASYLGFGEQPANRPETTDIDAAPQHRLRVLPDVASSPKPSVLILFATCQDAMIFASLVVSKVCSTSPVEQCQR